MLGRELLRSTARGHTLHITSRSVRAAPGGKAGYDQESEERRGGRRKQLTGQMGNIVGPCEPVCHRGSFLQTKLASVGQAEPGGLNQKTRKWPRRGNEAPHRDTGKWDSSGNSREGLQLFAGGQGRGRH